MASFNQGKNLAIVLQLQKANEKEVLALLQSNASEIFGLGRYAYILHDSDKLEDGSNKPSHIHIVFSAVEGKSSNNWVEHFAKLTHLDTSAVSVQMQGSEKKCLRYLLHLDDGAKHLYDRSQVVTNMDETCKKAWNAPSGFTTNPDRETLLEAYKNGPNALYDLVGLAGYEKAERVCSRLCGISQSAIEEQLRLGLREAQILINEIRRLLADESENDQSVKRLLSLVDDLIRKSKHFGGLL